MRISKRSLLSVVALALTIAVTAFGTVAYMTDSDTVTNTFTVGNINITVDEENVDGIPDENGNIIPERDRQNNYPLIPGLVQKKDPTMTWTVPETVDKEKKSPVVDKDSLRGLAPDFNRGEAVFE